MRPRDLIAPRAGDLRSAGRRRRHLRADLRLRGGQPRSARRPRRGRRLRSAAPPSTTRRPRTAACARCSSGDLGAPASRSASAARWPASRRGCSARCPSSSAPTVRSPEAASRSAPPSASTRSLGRRRNDGVEPELHLPAPRLVSKAATLRLFPGIRRDGLTGGAQWYDYQMVESDRLTFAFAEAADRARRRTGQLRRRRSAAIRDHGRVAGMRGPRLADRPHPRGRAPA